MFTQHVSDLIRQYLPSVSAITDTDPELNTIGVQLGYGKAQLLQLKFNDPFGVHVEQ